MIAARISSSDAGLWEIHASGRHGWCFLSVDDDMWVVPLTAAQARELADALDEAADWLEADSRG